MKQNNQNWFILTIAIVDAACTRMMFGTGLCEKLPFHNLPMGTFPKYFAAEFAELVFFMMTLNILRKHVGYSIFVDDLEGLVTVRTAD